MNLKPEFRQATINDTSSILNVHNRAFGQDSEARLVKAIFNSKYFIKELSLVSCIDKVIVGHVLFSTISIEGSDTNNVLALAPVAVLPESQNLKIGSTLINEGIKIADYLNYSLITVLGSPDYYHRFNFRTSTEYGITCPFETTSENFMIIPLSNYDNSHRGKIIYPEHFSLV